VVAHDRPEPAIAASARGADAPGGPASAAAAIAAIPTATAAASVGSILPLFMAVPPSRSRVSSGAEHGPRDGVIRSLLGNYAGAAS
jgi:hypothetical protein